MSHNTWMHRAVRVVVRPLVSTPVTPNQLTVLRLLTGMAGAAGFAVGSPDATFWGAVLFLVSMLLDRADGELARLTGKFSAYGHKLDLISDALCNGLVFVGIGIGLSAGSYGWWALPMGLLASLGVASILWMVVVIEQRQGMRAAEVGGVAGVDPDDAMLFIPLAMLLGWAEPLLLAAAIGAPVAALLFFRHFRESLLAPQPQQAGQGPQAVDGGPDAGRDKEFH